VSGCGKSTLGQELAVALNMPFIDGDSLHPKANIDKMAAGQPLVDADRYPWLELIRARAQQMCSIAGSAGVVIACSALRKSYRDILRGKGIADQCTQQVNPPYLDTFPTYFVFLKGTRDLLLQRMEARTGHFMKSGMLDSQLSTLETPEGEDGVVVVKIQDPTGEQVRIACESLRTFEETPTLNTTSSELKE
jgi:gluconokinase